MPYYYTRDVRATLPSRRFNSATGNPDPSSVGNSLITGSVETGFRTRMPQNGIATRVANSVADPYTVFDSSQALKQRAAVKGGFDASVFRIDRGHPWDLMKYEFSGPWSCANGSSGYTNLKPWHFPAGSGQGFDLALPRTDLSSFGALEYGRTSPLSDRFSFSAFTGELREGLPKFTSEVMRSRTKKIGGVGGDYLNAQFGWLPLLADLRGIALALSKASLGFYQPQGASHRQRMEKPTTLMLSETFANTTVLTTSGNYGDPAALKKAGDTGNLSGSIALRADIATTVSAERSRWFEAEFVYIPKAGFDATRYDDRLETLFKTDITPSDLWQLAPWTWLVDWYAQIGAALEAAEAATSNRVLSTYAYAMEKIVQDRICILSNIRPNSGFVYTGPKTVVSRWKTTSYRRIRANPFGFTVNPQANLSPGQLGILGALGLKKLAS